ncbi:MAG: hypothetical protein IJ087_21720 [Eggerthellaceae bacterium]|nr:hypothetical protein [Eggerthellaceae bacterium]
MNKQGSDIAGAKSVSYKIGENAVTHSAVFDDAENGIAWDGKDVITVKDASLSEINVEGSAEIRFQGESVIEHIIHSDGGDLTLVGDECALAAQRPKVTIGLGAVREDSDSWGYIASSKHDIDEKGQIVKSTYGNIAVKGLRIVFCSRLNAVEGQDVAIANSTLGVDRAADAALNVFANGKADIAGSVVDTGTAIWNDSIGYVGYIYTTGLMTIENSDVSVRPPEGWAETDGRASMSVSSATGVRLIGMANGEIKQKDGYSYIDTGDGDSVFLKASGE